MNFHDGASLRMGCWLYWRFHFHARRCDPLRNVWSSNSKDVQAISATKLSVSACLCRSGFSMILAAFECSRKMEQSPSPVSVHSSCGAKEVVRDRSGPSSFNSKRTFPDENHKRSFL